MTSVLNFFASTANYAGAGMVMFFLGIAAVILAAIKLGDLRKAERGRTVAEFNQQFTQDVGSRISDVEAGEKRRRIARDLGIRGRQ